MGTFAGKPFPESCRAYRYVTTLVNTLTIWRGEESCFFTPANLTSQVVREPIGKRLQLFSVVDDE